MLDNLHIILESNSGNYIITSVIGEKYLNKWSNFCKKNWIQYSVKFDIGIAILTNPVNHKNKNLYWQKYLIGSLLSQKVSLTRICFLDYDLIINPNSPNIFENIDDNKINLVSQCSSLPYIDTELTIRKKISFYRNKYLGEKYPLDSSILFSSLDAFEMHSLTRFDNFACMGVFVYSYSLFQDFLENIVNKYDGNENVIDSGDEILMNYELQKASVVNWIPYHWQSLWLFEVVNRHRHLYFSKFENLKDNYNAISSSLLNCHFLHFAGSVEKKAFDTLDIFWDDVEYDLLNSLDLYLHKKITPKCYGRIKD